MARKVLNNSLEIPITMLISRLTFKFETALHYPFLFPHLTTKSQSLSLHPEPKSKLLKSYSPNQMKENMGKGKAREMES